MKTAGQKRSWFQWDVWLAAWEQHLQVKNLYPGSPKSYPYKTPGGIDPLHGELYKYMDYVNRKAASAQE